MSNLLKHYFLVSAKFSLVLLFFVGCGKSLNDEEKSLVGKWNNGHEPVQYQFNEDLSYTISEVNEMGEAKIFENGTWSVIKGRLSFVPGDISYEGAKPFDTEFNFVGNILLIEPMPDISGGSVGEYGTLDEYAKEFGYTRAK